MWENECWVEGIITIDGISRIEYGDGRGPQGGRRQLHPPRRHALRRRPRSVVTSGTTLRGHHSAKEPAGARNTPAPQEGSGTLGEALRHVTTPPRSPSPDRPAPPSASPEASPVERREGRVLGQPSILPPPLGTTRRPATEEQWAIAREHIGAPPKVIALYERKHGTRKKKGGDHPARARRTHRGRTEEGSCVSRIRSVKPELFLDGKLAQILPSKPATSTSVCSPRPTMRAGCLHRPSASLARSSLTMTTSGRRRSAAWLAELEQLGGIIRYADTETQYFYLPYFLRHQRISHPSPSRLPEPPEEYSAEPLRRLSGISRP